MFASIAAVSAGAALGALLRWQLALLLNPYWPALPLGTLAANLVGGYAIGLAAGWLALHPELPPQVRLFLVTGLLGGLTTFSTYSAEVVGHLQGGRIAMGALLAGVHLAGSLVLTAAASRRSALLQEVAPCKKTPTAASRIPLAGRPGRGRHCVHAYSDP